MPENEKVTKPSSSPDRLLRGLLTKIGDTVDRFTGRRWKPSSSLAASELILRLKSLLDGEAKEIPGKGKVVPHLIQLKMQWDKFSTDTESSIKILENELLTAAVDHINDRLYYTYAPLSLVIKPDYFTEGVKLLVGFEKFDDEEREVEMNVTVPSLHLGQKTLPERNEPQREVEIIARFTVANSVKELSIVVPQDGRISVGRTAANLLTIEDASVSKIHASIIVGPEGTLAVADTGSTNGTFINGERIGYGRLIGLAPDDGVKFGTVEVRFEYKAPQQLNDEYSTVSESDLERTEIDGFEFSSKNSDRPLDDEDIKSNTEVDSPRLPDLE